MARTLRLLVAVLLVVSLAAVGAPAPARPAAPAIADTQRPGRAGDHTWLFDRKITWPSCGRLTYRVNPAKAPEGWRRLVRTAVRKTEQASRLRLRYLGRTRVRPALTRPNPPGTDIVIAFLNPRQTDMLEDPGVAGQGSAATDGRRLFDGKVVLNARVFRAMAPGFGPGPRSGIQGTTGQVVMHELGHVLGLGHARQSSQIMYPTATRKPAEWGAGDWAGLRALGRGGCDTRSSQAPGIRAGRRPRAAGDQRPAAMSPRCWAPSKRILATPS